MRHLSWEENLAYVKPEHRHRCREYFVGRATVASDGDIAMVWGKFAFSADGVVTHCGTDYFDLIREHGRWRVQNVTWIQREGDCAAGTSQ